MTDFADLLTLAELCNAAYTDDPAAQKAQVGALGFSFIDRYETPDHQAFLCSRENRIVLAISGTRISEGNIHELFDDEDVLPVKLGGDARVMQGFWNGQADLFAWVQNRAPLGMIDITGHSLGGARTHLAPAVFPLNRIGRRVSFAAPKAANAAYWSEGEACASLTRVVYGRDLWAGYPWIAEWCQPPSMLWLHDGIAAETTEAAWPGGLRAAHHSIDKAYIPALKGLITAQKSAASRAPGNRSSGSISANDPPEGCPEPRAAQAGIS